LIQHGGDASGLLRQADRALYTAKAMGRNQVVVASTDTIDQADGDNPATSGDRADAGDSGGADDRAGVGAHRGAG
jgi:hypothetical protein